MATTIAAMPQRRISAQSRPVPVVGAPIGGHGLVGAVAAIATAPFTGLGLAHYGSSAPAIAIAANVPTVLTMVLDPTQTSIGLRGPFAGMNFWDGSTLRTVNPNDVLTVRIGLSVTTFVAGGKLNIDAVIVGSGAVLSNDEKSLTAAAGPARPAPHVPLRTLFRIDLRPERRPVRHDRRRADHGAERDPARHAEIRRPLRPSR